MTSDRTLSAGPIRIDFRSVQQVLVEPADENRFMMTAKEAARACELAQTDKELRAAFSELLVYLRDWCGKQGKVEASYVFPGDGYLNILVCTHGDDYDFEFDDAVSELDIELTRQFAWLAAEVVQVPARATEGHAALEKAIIVYADGSRPPETGRA